MKRLISLALCLVLMLSLAGLSDSDIQRAMNMTAGAVRTMKYRLRRSPLNSPRGGA